VLAVRGDELGVLGVGEFRELRLHALMNTARMTASAAIRLTIHRV
jgi:hypothetical protein